MKISELPTARLRARAYDYRIADTEILADAFLFEYTTERAPFWLACIRGEFDRAKAMQPHLFEPLELPELPLLDEHALDESLAMLEGALHVRS